MARVESVCDGGRGGGGYRPHDHTPLSHPNPPPSQPALPTTPLPYGHQNPLPPQATPDECQTNKLYTEYIYIYMHSLDDIRPGFELNTSEFRSTAAPNEPSGQTTFFSKLPENTSRSPVVGSTLAQHWVNDFPFSSISENNPARNVHPMLVKCRASVADGGPTLNRRLVNVSC